VPERDHHRTCTLRIRSETAPVHLVPPWRIDTAQVGSAVRLITSWPASSQRPGATGIASPYRNARGLHPVATRGRRGLHAAERCASRRSPASVRTAISWPEHRSGLVPQPGQWARSTSRLPARRVLGRQAFEVVSGLGGAAGNRGGWGGGAGTTTSH
jgi:hypothetical protein